MFGFGKEELPPEEVWQADMKAAMASPETANRQDIAEMLWRKYEPMAKSATSPEQLKRAYDLIGMTVSQLQWPPNSPCIWSRIIRSKGDVAVTRDA